MSTAPNNVVGCDYHDNFVSLRYSDGTARRISWKDYVEGFNSAFMSRVASGAQEETVVASVTTRMPANCVSMHEQDMGNTLFFTLYYPSARYDLQFNDGGKIKNIESVLLPNIVIIVKLAKNKSTNLWARQSTIYYATPKVWNQIRDMDLIAQESHRDHIWKLPLPNIFSNGGMCYGKNSVPNTFDGSDFRGIDDLHRVIFDSPFNNDLSIPSLSGYSGSKMGWLTKLSKQKVFPYWLLAGSGWDNEEAFLKSYPQL